jgi:choline dehydrogenase-like flavoprotein
MSETRQRHYLVPGIEMTDARDLTGDESKIKTEVCIIGSGAGGSVMAYELSKQDKKIVLLEKGNYYRRDYIATAPENELARLWKNEGIFLSKTYSVNIAQGECLGGSTMINYGICFEIPDAVRLYWEGEFGIKISELEWKDAFHRVSQAMKRRKVVDAGKSHELFKTGCDSLGYSCDWMDKAYVPGAGADAGKSNAINAFLAKARADRLRILYNAPVEKIVVNGRQAVEVQVLTYSKNKPKIITIESDIVILAAGPVASTECLLKSGIEGSNGQVGKFLSLHPSSSLVADFDEPVHGDTGMAMACYCDEFSVRRTGRPGFMLESVFVPPSQLSITLPSFGKENRDYMRAYDNYAMAGVLVQDEPCGKVELNWSKEAVVNYDLSATDQAKMIDGIKEAARIFFRAGAKRVVTGHMKSTVLRGVSDLRVVDRLGAGMGSLLVASAHPQGGNRMGQNPEISVVDQHCRSHDISNLFVCDASVFPTSIGVNPQLTVMAIATLAADYIGKNI